MIKYIILYTALAICIAFSSGCNKDDLGTNPTDSKEPLVTLVGTPTGSAVTATIGTNGGTITSADGMLQLTVPAGAVSTATEFSIQPVSNQCPGGFGMTYRLFPEGITFAQPVSLLFSYADTLLSNEKFLSIAYQGADKTWFAPKIVALNADGNQIGVETKHFSDWTMYQKIAIEPMSKSIKINESLDLQVIFVGEPKITTDGEGNELSNLNISKTYASTWQVNGTSGNAASGYLVKQSENRATYSAPSVVPDKSHNPVAVSATLNNISFTLNGVTFNNPKVIANIRVVGNEVLFYVEFTSSRTLQPVGNSYFTETDRGGISVLLQDEDSVTVFNILNVKAEVTPNSLSDNGCTYTLSDPGDGFFNISPNVILSGIYSFTEHMVYIGINSTNFSKGFTPSFVKNCSGTYETIEGYEQPTLPAAFSFDANKDSQEFVQTIPGGGAFPDGFIKTTVTKIK